MSHELNTEVLFLSTVPLDPQDFVGIADVDWDAPAIDQVSGITYNAPGTFTLQPGREYELEAIIVTLPVTTAVSFIWVDAANSSAFTTFNRPASISVTALRAHAHAIARINPTVAITVHVRQASVGGNATVTVESSVRINTID